MRKEHYKTPRPEPSTPPGSAPLEDHGGHIPEGVWTRICQRLLALAAGIWHNWLLWATHQINTPGRHLTHHDH